MRRVARCECGGLEIALEGELIGTGLCHCFSCQRRTGSAFAALAVFRPPYKVRGKATDYVRKGDKGSRYRFRFCPTCGTNLFHTEEGMEARSVAVAVGGFADPDFPAPEASVYDCRRHPWVTVPPNAAVFDKDPE